jgi:hypothetical protein
MAEKAKTVKKIGRRKPARREVEIPILVVNTKKAEASQPENKGITEAAKNGNIFPQIIKDENDLPVFEGVSVGEENFSATRTEEETAELIREARQAEKERREVREETESKDLARGISAWSPAKKKAVMWFGVAAFTAVIFLVWISVLGKNLSLNLGSSSYTYLREAAENPELKQSFENVKELWSDLENAAGEEVGTDAEAAGDTLDKLQEKILVEEMKNKLENQ